MTFVPNPNWYGTKPTITKIVMTIGGDPEAAVASYERGDLDVVVVPGTSARRVVDDPALKPEVVDSPQLTIAYYDFATCQNPKKCPPSTTTADKKTPLSNKNFRIALTRAVNKQELIDVAYGGLGVPANGSVMPGIPGWPDDYDPYPFDVAAAQAAMKTALTERGLKDGPDEGTDVTVADVGKLKFGYNCDAGHTPRVVYLAGAWKSNLGFSESQFDISCTDFAVFRTERREGNKYDITRNAWGADFPHPDNQLRDLFATGAGNNNSGYANPAFDDLLAKASVEQDPAKSQALYVQAQRLLVDDAPVVWLAWSTQRYMVKPYVAGLVVTASDHQNIGDVFYETIQLNEH
jgi:oligopeptide transport system substrate-binding protein